MPTRIFDAETWRKIGQPDLGSKMFYIDAKTKKKIWGHVVMSNFGHKKGIELNIKKY